MKASEPDRLAKMPTDDVIALLYTLQGAVERIKDELLNRLCRLQEERDRIAEIVEEDE